MKELLKFLNKNNIKISGIKYIATEYNECGGYITFFDNNKNEFDVPFFSSDPDEIYELADKFSEINKIEFI